MAIIKDMLTGNEYVWPPVEEQLTPVVNSNGSAFKEAREYLKSVEEPTVAIKHDNDKPRYDLLPWDALDEVAQVLAYGSKKYTDRNWEKGFTWGRLVASSFRHLAAFARGEDDDPETGFSHLAHAACCVLFLLAHVKRGIGKDDRTVDSD